ncbi:hypothetical protein G6F68_016455 [Rhizopus microsporus]|nr:hypothetical protein G6F68_016455 [Rhizopus microsporus]
MPPALQRGQVVRGRHGNGVRRPGVRGQVGGGRGGFREGVSCGVLRLRLGIGRAHEPQHIHAQQPVVFKLGVEALRHGAQVLADDQRAVQPGFQRRQPQQLRQRVVQVGAVLRPGAIGDQPHPRHAQDMVDAHAARVRQAGAQHGKKRRVAGLPQGSGR